MWLAYFDESGDSGHPKVVNSPTKFFVLSGVLVHQDNWLATLDRLVALRRRLRTTYGISSRPEIKAQDIRPGKGVFRNLALPPDGRLNLYRELMLYQETDLVGVKCFSVAIAKAKIIRRDMDIRETAWIYAIERIDSFCQDNNDKAILFPDEGHGQFIRRLLRRLRRHHSVQGHYGQEKLKCQTQQIVEDPNDRRSHDSYLTQLADWNALACHRSRHIDPRPGMADDLWDLMPSRHLTEVNKLVGGPSGIKVWPA